MLITMALNFVITLVEVIGGVVSGSLSLISDALHNFSDGMAIIVSYAALRLARRPRTDHYTFGLKRAQVLAAILNAAVLLAVCVYLVKEAVTKLTHPAPVDGGIMLVVASVGLVANVIGTWLLRPDAAGSLNIRSAYLHLLSDAVSSVAVIIGALAIRYFDQYWVDPVLSLLIAVYIGWESWKITWTAVEVLLLRVPGTIDLSAVEAALAEHPDVRGVHHIHLWQVDDQDIQLEAHIDTSCEVLAGTEPIAEALERILRERYAIGHVTLQFENGRCLTARECR